MMAGRAGLQRRCPTAEIEVDVGSRSDAGICVGILRPMSREPVLKRSASTEHAVAEPRPRFRGWSHLIAAVVVPIGGWLWAADVEPGRSRIAVVAFVAGLSAMFLASTMLHLRRWAPDVNEVLLRLDHSGIYLAIGGTGIAVSLVGLVGWPSRVLLAVSLIGGTLGIVVEWLPFAPPRGFSNTVYITLGWIPIALLPWLWMTSGPVAVVLLFLGGVLYTSGAILLSLRRPKLSPRWFGYHEVWHLLVIVAASLHALMIAKLT